MASAVWSSARLRLLSASSMAERVALSARPMDSSAARSARCLVTYSAPPSTTTTTNAVERKIFPVSPVRGDALIPPPARRVGLPELVQMLDELVAGGVEADFQPAHARRPYLEGPRRELGCTLLPGV